MRPKLPELFFLPSIKLKLNALSQTLQIMQNRSGLAIDNLFFLTCAPFSCILIVTFGVVQHSPLQSTNEHCVSKSPSRGRENDTRTAYARCFLPPHIRTPARDRIPRFQTPLPSSVLVSKRPTPLHKTRHKGDPLCYAMQIRF